MTHLITVKLNLSKLEERWIVRGKRGEWTDLLLIETPNNEYGNSHMVVQAVTKDAKDQGLRGPIVGNTKTFGIKRGDDGSFLEIDGLTKE